MAQKVTIQTEAFLNAVAKAALWANKKSPVPATQSIRFTCADYSLEVSATDGISTDISLFIPVDTNVEFDICLLADRILPKAQILARVSDEMTMSVGKLVMIAAGKHSSRLSPIDTDLFPVILRDFDYDKGVPIDPQKLVDAVRKTIASADPNSPYPALEGIYLSNGDMVSADGTKIALCSNAHFVEEDTLVHATSFSKIVKALDGVYDASVLREGNRLVVFWDGGIVASTIIEYEFPDYKSIIPSGYETAFTIPRDELLNAVGLASTEAAESKNLVIIDAHQDGILVQSESSFGANSSEILPIEFDGPPKRFGISVKYLKDALSKIRLPNINIGINGTNGLVVLYDGEDYKYGIMPMHVRE